MSGFLHNRRCRFRGNARPSQGRPVVHRTPRRFNCRLRRLGATRRRWDQTTAWQIQGGFWRDIFDSFRVTSHFGDRFIPVYNTFIIYTNIILLRYLRPRVHWRWRKILAEYYSQISVNPPRLVSPHNRPISTHTQPHTTLHKSDEVYWGVLGSENIPRRGVVSLARSIPFLN